ncbi:MAG: glycosyltransferase family 4 protein [Terriglobales bacterium]|jgi:glycosyltransferase involved in cell wall biosynthesis
MITVFTPSFADEANTNAQNLTAKEIVSRLPSDRFRVVMLGDGPPDPRILARPNTRVVPSSRHGNTARWLTRVLLSNIDVYFFPREGPLDTLFLFFRRTLGLPIALVTYIVMALDEIPVRPTMTRSIREADCVIGNSRYVAQTIQDRFGVRTATIYSGIKRELFHLPAEVRGLGTRLTVLYAGSFQARKRVQVVIREAAHWPAVEFRLAGKGEEEAACRSLVNQLGCRNVTFVGHLSQPGLAEEMLKADVFLFPSVLEGHPQVLGQAASCGLPAVAMEKYRPDYIVNGETGYLVESESELSQKLGLLLTDQELRHRMSAAAARHALQFDWNEVAQDWESVLLEAAGKRRKKH